MTWYLDSGPQGLAIISSRIRLARNLEGFDFPARLDAQVAEAVADAVRGALLDETSGEPAAYLDLHLEELGPEERQSLVERRLISQELLATAHGAGLLLSRDEGLAIMVGEEDHIRIQAMRPGLDLASCWEEADRVSRALERKLAIAFDRDYGFLTACPTNTGTGLRASVMAHLPALTRLNQIAVLGERLGKLGFTVRGYHGEHSRPQGDLVQISNQLTLGIDEQELIRDLEQIVEQTIQLERDAQRRVFGGEDLRTEDRVHRALATLRSARLMSAEEAHRLLSELRLGLTMGLIDGIEPALLNRMMIAIEPATLQKAEGRTLDSGARDQLRAAMLRSSFAEQHISGEAAEGPSTETHGDEREGDA